jgi:hypothetical protein
MVCKFLPNFFEIDAPTFLTLGPPWGTPLRQVEKVATQFWFLTQIVHRDFLEKMYRLHHEFYLTCFVNIKEGFT